MLANPGAPLEQAEEFRGLPVSFWGRTAKRILLSFVLIAESIAVGTTANAKAPEGTVCPQGSKRVRHGPQGQAEGLRAPTVSFGVGGSKQ